MNRPTFEEIDLKALDFNLKSLKSSVHSAKFFPVVKADAYGHGIDKITKHIQIKVDVFCVATSEEAINLRSKSNKPILLSSNYYVYDYLLAFSHAAKLV